MQRGDDVAAIAGDVDRCWTSARSGPAMKTGRDARATVTARAADSSEPRARRRTRSEGCCSRRTGAHDSEDGNRRRHHTPYTSRLYARPFALLRPTSPLARVPGPDTRIEGGMARSRTGRAPNDEAAPSTLRRRIRAGVQICPNTYVLRSSSSPGQKSRFRRKTRLPRLLDASAIAVKQSSVGIDADVSFARRASPGSGLVWRRSDARAAARALDRTIAAAEDERERFRGNGYGARRPRERGHTLPPARPRSQASD
jgi:hypothetical protein